MPSTSKKQHNFMAAIANNPAFAKKVGIPQSVGSDFTQADKGRKFAKGGDMATKGMNMGGMPMKSGGGVKKGGYGATMRVTLSDHELAHVFPDGEKGMTGTLHGGDTKKAVFLIKTS
jgi:hypothetical protein